MSDWSLPPGITDDEQRKFIDCQEICDGCGAWIDVEEWCRKDNMCYKCCGCE